MCCRVDLRSLCNSPCHVCIVALSNDTHCAMSQVVEAALQCLKTNPAAAVHALPFLKPALASLMLNGTPIQRPGKTSFPMCSFPQTAGSAALHCCSRLYWSYAFCNFGCSFQCSLDCNFGCNFGCSFEGLANISTWLLHISIESPVTVTLHSMMASQSYVPDTYKALLSSVEYKMARCHQAGHLHTLICAQECCYADEMEEDVNMTAQEYQVLVVRKVCRCAWHAQHIPDFLAFLGGLRL